MFPKVVVFKSCFEFFGWKTLESLIISQLCPASDRAFQVEFNTSWKIRKNVVHNHKVPFIFFIVRTLPDYFMKAVKSTN